MSVTFCVTLCQCLSPEPRVSKNKAWALKGDKVDDSREDDLWTRVVGLETKMDTVIKSLTKKEEDQPTAAAKGAGPKDFQITSLHNKVDKCMRMILEVTEGLQKTSKFIKQLQNAEKKSEKEEEKVKKEEMTRIHTARFSTAGRLKMSSS